MKTTDFVLACKPSAALFACCLACLAPQANAAPVFVPDNGFGTANMPILASYVAETPMEIVDGLPLGTTIQLDAVLNAPAIVAEQAGGTLGGTRAGGGSGGLFSWLSVGA